MAPMKERRAALSRIADAVRAKAGELAPLLVREHGMPMKFAMIEIMVFAMKLQGASAQPLPVKKIEVGPGDRGDPPAGHAPPTPSVPS